MQKVGKMYAHIWKARERTKKGEPPPENCMGEEKENQ